MHASVVLSHTTGGSFLVYLVQRVAVAHYGFAAWAATQVWRPHSATRLRPAERHPWRRPGPRRRWTRQAGCGASCQTQPCLGKGCR